MIKQKKFRANDKSCRTFHTNGAGRRAFGERFIWWNFVSSRKERIEQAKADWQEGKIVLPPNDNKEFIPLPEDRLKLSTSPSPEPLS
jgi:hypothetical protein